MNPHPSSCRRGAEQLGRRSHLAYGAGRALSIGGLLLLVALGSGCRILDRERYSLVIRKPAHRYRELTPAERARVEEDRAGERPTADGAGDELPPPEVERPGAPSARISPLEPFRPFAYCHTHGSAHVAESLVAVLLAPAEFPILVVVDTGTDLSIALARELESWWHLVFPSGPTEKEPKEIPDSPGAPP